MVLSLAEFVGTGWMNVPVLDDRAESLPRALDQRL
jgi:hypothetical protein